MKTESRECVSLFCWNVGVGLFQGTFYVHCFVYLPRVQQGDLQPASAEMIFKVNMKTKQNHLLFLSHSFPYIHKQGCNTYNDNNILRKTISFIFIFANEIICHIKYYSI